MRDEMIDQALRRAPEVHIPQHFANRVVASLPTQPIQKREREWFLPALTVAGGATLASLAWVSFALGADRWLAQPAVLASVLAVEAAASLVWVWRTYRAH